MKPIFRTILKMIATGDALIAAAIELSEVSNEYGEPMPGWEPQWHALAARVAIEAAQERADVKEAGGP